MMKIWGKRARAARLQRRIEHLKQEVAEAQALRPKSTSDQTTANRFKPFNPMH